MIYGGLLLRRFLDWELRTLLHEEQWEFRHISTAWLESIGFPIDGGNDRLSRKAPTGNIGTEGIAVNLKGQKLKIEYMLTFPMSVFIGIGYVFEGNIEEHESGFILKGRFRSGWWNRAFSFIWWNGLFLFALIGIYFFIKSLLNSNSIYYFRSEGDIPAWLWWIIFPSIPLGGYLLGLLLKALSSRHRTKILAFLNSLSESSDL